jgi:hypothetical protein
MFQAGCEKLQPTSWSSNSIIFGNAKKHGDFNTEVVNNKVLKTPTTRKVVFIFVRPMFIHAPTGTSSHFLVKKEIKETKAPDRGSYVWDPCAEGRPYQPDLNQSTTTRYKEKRLVSKNNTNFLKGGVQQSI